MINSVTVTIIYYNIFSICYNMVQLMKFRNLIKTGSMLLWLDQISIKLEISLLSAYA